MCDQKVASHNFSIILVETKTFFLFRQSQAATASQLASLRYRDLLGYSKSMPTAQGKQLVASYYSNLVDGPHSVQGTLEKRNKRRRRHGLLPYRNMLPAFLPNSIAI